MKQTQQFGACKFIFWTDFLPLSITGQHRLQRSHAQKSRLVYRGLRSWRRRELCAVRILRVGLDGTLGGIICVLHDWWHFVCVVFCPSVGTQTSTVLAGPGSVQLTEDVQERLRMQRLQSSELWLRGAQPVDGLEYDLELVAGRPVRRIADGVLADQDHAVEGGSRVEVREALGRDERADLREAVGEHERRQLQRETVRASHEIVALQSHMPG